MYMGKVSGMAANKKGTSKELNISISSIPSKPSAEVVKVNDESEVTMSKLFELVPEMKDEQRQINKKLDKLDTIKEHLSRLDKDIAELKNSYTFVNNTADELKKGYATHGSLIANLNQKIQEIETKASHPQRDLVDLGAQSLQCNLPFYILPEREEEDTTNLISNLRSIF